MILYYNKLLILQTFFCEKQFHGKISCKITIFVAKLHFLTQSQHFTWILKTCFGWFLWSPTEFQAVMYIKWTKILWQKWFWPLGMRKYEGLDTVLQYLRVVINKKLEKSKIFYFSQTLEQKFIANIGTARKIKVSSLVQLFLLYNFHLQHL